MTPPATVAVFGGTGRTGVPTLEALLAAGYAVRAQARDPQRMPIQHERLTVLQGDFTDPQAVADVVEGSDAVVNLVGHVKGSPPDVLTQGVRNVVTAMRFYEVSRVINLTGAGVPFPADHPKVVDKVFRFVMRTFFGDVIRDAVGSSEVLRASALDYTNVRAPRLTDGAPRATYTEGYVGDIGSAITRADLAEWLVGVLRDDRYLRDEPAVSN